MAADEEQQQQQQEDSQGEGSTADAGMGVQLGELVEGEAAVGLEVPLMGLPTVQEEDTEEHLRDS